MSGGSLLDDLPCRFWINLPRALLVEHKSQRISARFNRGQRVFQIRGAANLDPSHEPSHEPQFPVASWEFSELVFVLRADAFAFCFC